MLKKQLVPTSNNSKNILIILSGAKKRRIIATSAVKALDGKGISVVKPVAVK